MATYYIRTDGNNANVGTTNSSGGAWATFDYAVSNAVINGDIIHIVSGSYTVSTQCNLAVGVSIEGEGTGSSVINSTQTGDWSTLLSLDSPVNTSGSQTISGVTFDGGYVSEASVKTWVGIWISGRSDVIIHDCKITKFYDRGIIYDGHKQTNPLTDPGYYSVGNKFYNNSLINTCRNTIGYGAGQLNIGGQQGMEIYNNNMIQTQRLGGYNGWPIKYWENGFLKGCKIYNNNLSRLAFTGSYQGGGDWDFAIELFNIQGLQIYNNNISGSIDLNYNYKGSYDYSVWIYNNTINNSIYNQRMQSGIIFEFATQTAIVENNTIGNVSHPILFNARTPSNSGGYLYSAPTGGYSALTNNIIRNNLIYNIYNTYDYGFCCGGVGLQVYLENETNDPYIRNLNIYNNTFIVRSGSIVDNALDFAYFTSNSADVDGINVRNNVFVGFNGAYLIGSNPTHASNIVLTHNDAYQCGNSNLPSWPGGNPTGYTYNNNLTVNPLFTNSGSFDYTLQNNSTLIDAGVDVGTIYYGAAPDIGYWESGSLISGNIVIPLFLINNNSVKILINKNSKIKIN